MTTKPSAKKPMIVDGTPFTFRKFFSRRFLLVLLMTLMGGLSLFSPSLYHALVGNWGAISAVLAFILGDSAYKIVVAYKNTLDQ